MLKAIVIFVLPIFLFSWSVNGQGVKEFVLKNKEAEVRISNNLQYSLKFKSTLLFDSLSRSQINYSFNGKDDFNAAIIKVTQKTDASLVGIVTNSVSQTAKVTFLLSEKEFSVQVSLDTTNNKQWDSCIIDFSTKGGSPSFGLGDHGGYQENLAITNYKNLHFADTENAFRFVSNFSYFPEKDYAQVLFETKQKRVIISDSVNSLGEVGNPVATAHYMFGNVKEIYANYKDLRIKNGFPMYLTDTTFFKTGYEAFGSLGWNTFQTSIIEDMSNYKQHGYDIKWAILGSGFWKGSRKDDAQGATTSFGIWDSINEPDRIVDNLPNPRFPNPQQFKDYFTKNKIALMLGYRINFKAERQFGGNYSSINDGTFPIEGKDSNYFVSYPKDKNFYKVVFPHGNVYLLDSKQSKAINWFTTNIDKWGVKGFKEDLMLLDGKKLNNDAIVDPVNAKLLDKKYLIMARNSSYSPSGHVLRIEDTGFKIDRDRTIMNGLSYAASGVGPVYLDIVAGKYLTLPLSTSVENYFARNAVVNSLSPTYALGLGPWNIKNQTLQNVVFNATKFHDSLYYYWNDASIKSFLSGFPYLFTPLPLAFPKDVATYFLANKKTRQFEWMIGESILAAPLYGQDIDKTKSRDVYLPKGIWMDYNTGERWSGPITLKEYEIAIEKNPIFIGGNGFLVVKGENGPIAKLYDLSQKELDISFKFSLTSDVKLKALKRLFFDKSLIVFDKSANKKVAYSFDKKFRSISFPITKSHSYVLYNQ